MEKQSEGLIAGIITVLLAIAFLLSLWFFVHELKQTRLGLKVGYWLSEPNEEGENHGK